MIANAVLITNKAIDSSMKSIDYGLICKLDIVKVYDHINRD